MRGIALQHSLEVVTQPDFVALLVQRTRGLSPEKPLCDEIARALIEARNAWMVLQAQDPIQMGRSLGYPLRGNCTSPKHTEGRLYPLGNEKWLGYRAFEHGKGKGIFFGLEERKLAPVNHGIAKRELASVNRIGVTEWIEPTRHAWAFHLRDFELDRSFEIEFP